MEDIPGKMEKRDRFNECLKLATDFVAYRRAMAPKGFDPKNFDIGNIFGSKPKVIKKKKVSATEEAGKAIAGNIQNLPELTKLGNLYSASELEQLNKIIPGFSDNMTAGGAATKTLLGNAQTYLEGEIPQDVQDAVQRSSAYQALQGGYAGSPMAGALTARDLGLTSLDLQKTGANMLGQGLNSQQGWDSLARRNMLDPGSMMVSSGQQLQQSNMEALAQQQYRQNVMNVRAQPDPLAKGIFDSTMQTIGMVLSIYGGGGGYKPQQAQAAQPNFNQGGMYGGGMFNSNDYYPTGGDQGFG